MTMVLIGMVHMERMRQLALRYHQQEVEQLEGIVDPLGDSQFYGIDIYMEVVCSRDRQVMQ